MASTPRLSQLVTDETWSHDCQPHPGRRMTEEEFVAWADDTTRAEWVDGEVIMMAPISDDHDEYQFWLRVVLHAFVKRRGLGRVKGPEFMMRFGAERAWREPDILFVATPRLEIIKRNRVEGAPDLVIEIVSPESRKRDWEEKFAQYASAGVREYWVLDREKQRVEAYALGDDAAYHRLQPGHGKITSTVIAGFYLRVEWLLAQEPPDEAEVLRELLGEA